MSNQIESIALIKISDSLKEIDLTNFKTCENNAFILCKYSFINYDIYINKFMNKQLSKIYIQIINQNSPRFIFSFEEIMSFINKIDIYIVNRNYLIHRGIYPKFLEYTNLAYYIHNGKRYLFFFNELKLFKIEPGNTTILSNQKKLINIKYEDINNFSNKQTKKILEKYANNDLLNKKANNKIDDILDKLRKENFYLKKELKDLKDELNNEQNKNKQLNLKIKELEEFIKKEKENKFKEFIENNNNNKIIKLYEELRTKDKELKDKNEEIKNLKSKFPFELGENEELMSVIFISTDSSIHHSIICKNTDQFTKIETQLYKEYPKYRYLENYFVANGNKINKYISLKENNIKNSDIIALHIFDE